MVQLNVSPFPRANPGTSPALLAGGGELIEAILSRGRGWGKSKIFFSFILRSMCYFSRSLHEALRLKAMYFQGKT